MTNKGDMTTGGEGQEFLIKALGSGNRQGNSFHEEDTLRGRIGHNMKIFLMAYCVDLGKKSRPSTIRRQWHLLKEAGAETLSIISSVQRRRAFLLLERQGYIYRSVSTIAGKKRIAFKFTEKGLDLQRRYSDEALLSDLSREAIEKSLSDNRTYVVSWDIPEALRKKRALFRQFVRSLGFRLLHRSFFVGDINISAFLAKAAKLLEIDKFIHYGTFQPAS
jgi:hypothetical protein